MPFSWKRSDPQTNQQPEAAPEQAEELAVQAPAEGTPVTSNVAVAPADPYAELKHSVHDRMIKEVDLQKFRNEARTDDEKRQVIEEMASGFLAQEAVALGRLERQRIVKGIVDEVLGLGPLEPLLADPTISEVMVNRPNQVYYERRGVLHLSNVTFRDSAHIMRIIEKIIAPLGRRIDEASPMVDARLQDGSRVNCIIPPLAVDSPSITIRKFSRDPFTVQDLINFTTLTPQIAQFLKGCVTVRQNMVVSGGTGTGKTTLLNVLSSFIPDRERLVTVEDPCELQMRQPHIVRLETRPPNIENKGEITQRQLVRNALRMRPDRIIVGEVRAGEAFDMLQAMNTGHDGSLTTVHANQPRDALARIENMVLMAGFDLPVRAIREQVASAINLIVHISRFRDGARRVTHVTEIAGMEGDVITLQDIFLYHQTGVDEHGMIVGEMRATGLRPKCADRFEQEGIEMPAELFARVGVGQGGNGKWR